MHTGIDIASHQHPHGQPIDYAQASAKIEFVSVKASEWRPTNPYRNPFWWQDVDGFRAQGTATGSYLWFTPSDGDAQANFFCDMVGELRDGDLFPMVDVEEEGVDGWELERCLRTIEWRMGVRPFVYGGANPHYNKPLIQCYNQNHQIADYPLWVASYGFEIGHGPGLIGPWDSWAVWQQTSTGEVAGINAWVDVDYAMDLDRYVFNSGTIIIPDETKDKVETMYNPSLNVDIVASCPGPDGKGALLLGRDGGVFSMHAPISAPAGWLISPVGQEFWGDREGADISLEIDGSWTVTANTGETYTFPIAP